MYNPNINLIKMLLSNRSSEDLFKSMFESDPNFKKFITDNKDKSIEDIAMAYDIDFNMLKQFM